MKDVGARPICRECGIRPCEKKSATEWRGSCARCRDARRPLLDLSSRPICPVCNERKVGKSGNKWRSRCNYCEKGTRPVYPLLKDADAPICDKCGENTVGKKTPKKWRKWCDRCIAVNSIPQPKERPMCRICGKNPVVKRSRKGKIKWGTKCCVCVEHGRVGERGPRPLCSVCGKRPVKARSKAKWLRKCRVCIDPLERLGSYRREQYRQQWLASECKRCGATERLELDHIDGNRWNEDENNLQTLCRKCHSIKTIENKEYLPFNERPAQKAKMSEAGLRTRLEAEGGETCGMSPLQTLSGMD